VEPARDVSGLYAQLGRMSTDAVNRKNIRLVHSNVVIVICN